MLKYAKVKFIGTMVFLSINLSFLIFGIYLMIKMPTKYENKAMKENATGNKTLLILFMLIRFFTLIMFSKMQFDLKKHLLP